MFRFRQLVEISVQKKQVCGCAEHARDGGVIPITGFPRVDDMANEEERATSIAYGENMWFISYNKHAFGPRAVVLAVIPSKSAFGAVRVQCDIDVHGS